MSKRIKIRGHGLVNLHKWLGGFWNTTAWWFLEHYCCPRSSAWWQVVVGVGGGGLNNHGKWCLTLALETQGIAPSLAGLLETANT